MKYTQRSFSVAVGSDEYRENWDRIFNPVVRVTIGGPLICQCDDCNCEDDGPGDGPCADCAKGLHACSCGCLCYARILGGAKHARCAGCEKGDHRSWEDDGVLE